jgi:urease gamma subunit
MNPTWLTQVLSEFRFTALNTPARRQALADAITEAIPLDVVVAAIMEAATAVLRNRNIRDGAGDLAREIARNGAQSVQFMLQVGEGDTPAIDLPEVTP